jgi:chromosome segregation ATPase
MARDATISQQEVDAVAEQLRVGGERPTARAVRARLGRGSMATVLRYLRVWQAGQARPVDSAVALPPALQRALLDFIGQEVLAAKAALEAELALAQQVNTDLLGESERQMATLEEMDKTLETLRYEQAEVLGRMAQLANDLTASQQAAEAQRQAAEAARTELATQRAQLERLPRLEAEIERLRSALDGERAARAVAEQAVAVAAAKLDKTEGQVSDLRDRLGRAEEDARAATQALVKLRG